MTGLKPHYQFATENFINPLTAQKPASSLRRVFVFNRPDAAYFCSFIILA